MPEERSYGNCLQGIPVTSVLFAFLVNCILPNGLVFMLHILVYILSLQLLQPFEV